MKTLVLLALAGFVLAIGLALPFSEDKDEVDTAELKEFASDLAAENSNVYSEDDLDDKDERDEDENDEDENAVKEDEGYNDDEEGEDEEDETKTSLSSPEEESSDPIFLIPRLIRVGRRVFRRRRGRRGGQRRWRRGGQRRRRRGCWRRRRRVRRWGR